LGNGVEQDGLMHHTKLDYFSVFTALRNAVCCISYSNSFCLSVTRRYCVKNEWMKDDTIFTAG